MNPRLVLLSWEDASCEGSGPWVSQEDAPPMRVVIFHQVGFVLEDTPECIVLTCAMENRPDGLMASRERIPRGMVRSIVDLVPDAAKPPAKAKRKTA
jgi:hypothetical protein